MDVPESGLYKRIKRLAGRAIHDYAMINDGDRILVGVSGGRDSLTLLTLLDHLRKRAPVDFALVPVYVDPGFDIGFSKKLQAYMEKQFCPIHMVYTDHGVMAHSSENRKNPCFLCSRLRRKTLFETAKEKGCFKIALGHNKDDLIETLFMNILYAGRIGTMKPFQSFFKGAMSIIRPLAYVEKDEILKLSDRLKFPDFINPCPSAGTTKRDVVRSFLQNFYKGDNRIKGNIFNAMGRVETDYLLKQTL